MKKIDSKLDNEWIKREIFHKDAEWKYYCEDPIIHEALKHVVFLYKKLKYLKPKIESEYDNFLNSIVNDFKKDAKKRLETIKKDGSNEVKVKQVFVSTEASNELFFYLDTFFIDVKRIIEFIFRFLYKCENLDASKFKLENMLKHLSEKSNNNKSEMVKILIKKYSNYVDYILSNLGWFESVNKRRTDVTHYKILNKTGNFEIEHSWNAVMTREDDPLTKLPILTISDKPIKELINEDFFNVEQFFGETLILKKDLIKETKII